MNDPASHIRAEEFIPIQENDLYHFKCINGHDNLLEIQAFKFEILFESGLCAIKDKYFLESGLSLTASIERFYEFFIRIVMKANGLTSDIIEKTFKNIANQSERQFGAFVCMYGLIYKEKPPVLLGRNFTEFRNKVVHKGYLPNEDEILDYAKEVFKIIKFYYSKILLEYKNHIIDYSFEIQKQRRIYNKDLIDKFKVPITSMAPCFAITHILNLEDFNKQDFNSCFDLVKRTNFYG